MIYALTPEQHAQIVDAMSVSYPTDRSKLSAHIEALALLKGLKPLEPCANVQQGRSVGAATKTKSYGPTSYNPVQEQISEGCTDTCYEQAVEIVKQRNKAGISLVQRELMIGYNRATRLLEQMEKAGVVISNGNGTYRMPTVPEAK